MLQEGDVCNPDIRHEYDCTFCAASVPQMNHVDLKMALVFGRQTWAVCTGLEETQLKIKRDESDKKREAGSLPLYQVC